MSLCNYCFLQIEEEMLNILENNLIMDSTRPKLVYLPIVKMQLT